MISRTLRLLALPCALAATIVACNDSTAPGLTDFTGEWLFSETYVSGPEDGCAGSGSYVLSAASATTFTGLIGRLNAGCPLKPYGTAVLNGLIAGSTVSFAVGPCTYTGTFAGGARDSVTGTFTCAPPVPAGTGTWRAARAGVPTSMTLNTSVATLVVGGSVRLTATFTDDKGRVVYPRVITWLTGDTLVDRIVVDPTPGASSVTVTAIAPGVTNVVAKGHIPAAGGTEVLLGGNTTITVSTISFASIAAGTGETCGLTPAGEMWCWGSSFSRATPVPQFPGVVFTSVSSGGLYTCGVQSGGAVQCSGLSAHGNTGVVSGARTYASVSVGANHSCAVTTAGAAFCWGDNTGGQLGDNGTLPQALPVAVAGGIVFASVSAGGSSHSCGLTPAGAAWCWGFNGSGELGDGSTTTTRTPVAVAGGLTFTSIAATDYITCGVATGGAAYCWGRNAEGQLGIGSTDTSAHPLPLPVAGGLTFASTSATFDHACGVTTAHAVYCWGTGALGSATTSSTTPIAISGGLSFSSVSVQSFHSCGLTTGNVAYCWGTNTNGALGDGTTTASAVPVKVRGQT